MDNFVNCFISISALQAKTFLPVTIQGNQIAEKFKTLSCRTEIYRENRSAFSGVATFSSLLEIMTNKLGKD